VPSTSKWKGTWAGLSDIYPYETWYTVVEEDPQCFEARTEYIRLKIAFGRVMVAIFGEKVAASFSLNHRGQKVSGVYIAYLCMRYREKEGKLQYNWHDGM
jgi:hypothetical protein